MKLEDLATEALELILSDCDGTSVLALWKSGSVSIRHKLMNGGVISLSLRSSSADNRNWPHCLPFLKLRSLKIVLAGSLRVGRLTGQTSRFALLAELKSLNPSLKRLEVCFRDLSDVLKLGMPTAAVNKLSAGDAQADLQVWDMNDTWPQLEHLCFATKFQSDEVWRSSNFAPLPSIFFAQLPRSLLSLDIRHTSAILKDEHLQSLPPSLTSLLLPKTKLSASALRCLPKSLTHLDHFNGDHKLVFSEEAVQLLVEDPSVLPNLEFSAISGQYQVSEVLYEAGGRQWPACVTAITLMGDSGWELIKSSEMKYPSRLKTLALMLPDYDVLDSTIWLNTYPFASLTTLTVDSLDWSNVKPETWPQTLTHLSIVTGERLSPLLFNRFPRYLLQLHIGQSLGRWEHQKFDPKDALAAGRESLQSPTDRRIWMKEYEKLRNGLYERNEAYRNGVNKYLEDVESGMHFGLPLRLTHLSITGVSLHEGFGGYYAPLLPPHVITLRLSQDVWLREGFRGLDFYLPEEAKHPRFHRSAWEGGIEAFP